MFGDGFRSSRRAVAFSGTGANPRLAHNPVRGDLNVLGHLSGLATYRQVAAGCGMWFPSKPLLRCTLSALSISGLENRPNYEDSCCVLQNWS